MFEPVNHLERSLENAVNDPSARPQFYRDILESDIFIIHDAGSDLNIKNNILQEDAEVKVQHLEKDGILWLPIFSSVQRVEQFTGHESGYLRLPAKDFFKMTRGAYVLLNPCVEYGKEFVPQEIQNMLDGSLFEPVQTYVAKKDTQVLVGQPAVYPRELVKILAANFAKDPLVRRAYLAQFFNPETDEKPHILIGVDARGEWEKVIGDAGLIASEVLGNGEVVDFIRVDNSGISQYMVHQTKPFYQKSFLKKLFGE